MTARGALLLLMLLSSTACQPARSPDDPAVRAEAQQLWRDRCANCHGPHGDGDGPQARHLLVAPRRLSSAPWLAGVSDEHLRTVILEGGPAVGLSPVMAANPDLRERPEVLAALVALVRALPGGEAGAGEAGAGQSGT
jgi:mono/diheme cytochrome c family protein